VLIAALADIIIAEFNRVGVTPLHAHLFLPTIFAAASKNTHGQNYHYDDYYD
jgi:hypothetical protein